METKLRLETDFNKYEELKAQEARIGIALKQNDKEEIQSQFTLFDDLS